MPAFRVNYWKIFLLLFYFWIWQFTIGYFVFTFITEKPSHISASATDRISNGNDKSDLLCADCRLVSDSINDLRRQPRQINLYGQIEEKLDLEKVKKAVCKDLMRDDERERCRNFYFSKISTLEKWKQTSPKVSFFDFGCIKELKYCCPDNSYGLKCTKCPKCKVNEVCHGEGTRSGNGTCICKEGHSGPSCSSCLKGYYVHNTINRPPEEPTCKPCHRSCLYCRGGGSANCEVCRDGYYWLTGSGCVDIDECLQGDRKICGDNTFCVNTEGSYFCYECDRSCDGCHGDGPDMCLRCAQGYKMEGGNCLALKKTILRPEANYYRYAIYVGLCLCTCIILHNSVYLASLIGLSVAIYVSTSEYLMSNYMSNANLGHTDLK